MAKIERVQYITHAETTEQILLQSEAFLKGGGKWVQLRMKSANYDQFLHTAKLLKPLCDKYSAALIINDNVEVCKEVDAAGVHLGQMDCSVIQARKVLGGGKIIGLTCNTLEHILDGYGLGVDYLGVGPFRFTTTKKKLSPMLGLDGYKELVDKSGNKIPMVAVGGITLEDVKPILCSGVYGVALSGIITNSCNPQEITQQIINQVENAI